MNTEEVRPASMSVDAIFAKSKPRERLLVLAESASDTVLSLGPAEDSSLPYEEEQRLLFYLFGFRSQLHCRR